jgi:hypothetical protein
MRTKNYGILPLGGRVNILIRKHLGKNSGQRLLLNLET